MRKIKNSKYYTKKADKNITNKQKKYIKVNGKLLNWRIVKLHGRQLANKQATTRNNC